MTDIAISVKNVSKCYRVFDDQRSRLLHALWPKHTAGMQEVWALKDINFEVKRGEAVAIIGRNGGGKSTLLEILTGTLTPTTGIVKVNGRVSALLELGSGFNPEYSGRDNVLLNGLLLGLSRDEILGRFHEIEAFAEIGDAIDRPVKTYSSGMMMRLAFAVQVLCDPDILIIDEALSVGDFFFQQKCLSYIRRLRAEGVTLLFVSHDMGTVRDICERSLYVKQGGVIFDGDVNKGISLFLNENSSSSVESRASGLGPDFSLHSKSNEEPQERDLIANIVRDSIWRSSENNASGKLLAVALYDENYQPKTTFKIGERLIIHIAFSPDGNQENHVGVIFFDKYGAIRTSTGSLPLKKMLPKNTVGTHVFEAKIDLMIETGQYGLQVNLGYPIGNNHGQILDETNMIGPINIYWDYQVETPPFFGQVGLPVSAKYLV